jgi:hypothetical protein
LGGNQAFVEHINDDGVGVGAQTTADGAFHAFRHTDLGGAQDLAVQAGFGPRSFASAISPDGTIVGHADRADGTGVLFGNRYTAAAGRVDVCESGCSVWDVNAHGQLVGLLLGKDTSTWQAFVFATEGGLRALGTLGGRRSSASAISEAGLVVGSAQVAGSALEEIGHAFIYDSRAETPALRDLNQIAGTRDWVLESASEVNEAYVVGYGVRSGRPAKQKSAFRYDLRSGELLDLGSLPGGTSTVAWAVSPHGDVVGWVEVGGVNTAAVYGAQLGGLRKLSDFVNPALGWDLRTASAINRRGIIVGWGYRNGAARGYKLALPVCVGP